MKDLGERIASLEVEVKVMSESIERFRKQISEFWSFKTKTETYFAIVGGIFTLSNVILLYKAFAK